MTSAHETGPLLNSTALPGGYQLLRLQLPQLSQTIAAGQQLRIEGAVLPVMRAHPGQQWLELLSATVQPWNVDALLQCQLLGEPFQRPHATATALLIAEDLGLAPITFLAELLRKERRHSLLVLLGFTQAIPFRPAPSRILVNGLPAGVIATMPLLEDWLVPGRIAHADEAPGCFGGDVLTLARHWLQQPHDGMAELYLCGSDEMGEAGTSLAQEFGLKHQAIGIRG